MSLPLSVADESAVAESLASEDTTGEGSESHRCVIIGAGPAGLTAAYQLGKALQSCVVLESTDAVGGISQTVERDGYRFDIGGHRFFTKSAAVQELWDELLDDDEFLVRPRLSRIYYRGKLFDYPLKPLNALRNLGVLEAALCIGSYVKARVRPPKDQTNFEGWVAARFGWRLYRTFFKTYTEKVWGVSATEIQADWAAQRIKNLSLLSAIANALGMGGKQGEITTLIEQFRYPKYGPGMMWERARDRAALLGADVRMETSVVQIRHRDGAAYEVETEHAGRRSTVPADSVISSMPLSQLVQSLQPAPPEPVLEAARALRYRDFLTVALVVPQDEGFPDNWIYIHDPSVRVGRIQNFRAWSPYMVQPGRTCLGLEYFVNEGDALWDASDEELIDLATRELRGLNLFRHAQVDAGYVVRMPKAYPTYDAEYAENVSVIRQWLDANAPNIAPVGRNGMHRYNNADHSMLTAMLAVENILGATPAHDVWAVNVDDEYHEDGDAAPGDRSGTGRDAPVLPRSTAGERVS